MDQVETIRELIQAGLSNADILHELAQKGIQMSLSTLQRRVKKYDLREAPDTAMDRSYGWIAEVKAMVRSSQTLAEILYYLEKNFGESISRRTLCSVLKVTFFTNHSKYEVSTWTSLGAWHFLHRRLTGRSDERNG